ncbi:MAG TPA: exo-alpha-sialidase [Flexivirga sp.]|uniref:exo-alpha-sialidase n=1 Tax=Flexivirga sp. TaxID=1962927 RepID=UPI002B5544A8|nr:exo-alpha-sialidase [Flexivirga sp.]HWC23043.1 exo-alpha-sialidase [Flexivirga sp.]
MRAPRLTRPLVALAAGALLASTALPSAAAAAPSGDASTTLATRGEGGFPQYRIPALTRTTKGTLIAAYDGRPTMADLPSNIAMIIRRSSDGGRTWTKQQVVRQDPAPHGYGDPSLLVDNDTGRIFLFYAAGMNQGFVGSATGNDPTDPNVLQADYSYSDDDGLTWHSRRITPQVKDPSWGGMFAASGQGIQLTTGPYAGRLIQQYVIRIDGQNYAASAYSDDHGNTWQMGKPVGPGMDENKTVQLSDGSVMLNVRAAGHRLVAISHDGGETYSKPVADPTLVDPGDNGAVLRVAPNAPASDPASHLLLSANNDDPSIRRNETVRLSCDDGKTWAASKVIDKESSAYSTLAMVTRDTVGLFYERDGYQHLTYTSFPLASMKALCAPISADASTIQAGSAGSVPVTITNQTGHALAAGSLAVTAPEDWTAPKEVPTPPIPTDGSATVRVPITAPLTSAPGDHTLSVRYAAAGKTSNADLTVSVDANDAAPAAPKLRIESYLDHLTAAGRTGTIDDVATYFTRITNTGNTTLTNVTVTGNQDNLPRCHYSSLAAGASYLCKYGTHAISDQDVANGSYAPRLTVTGENPAGTTSAVAKTTGEAVQLPNGS